jgi:O-succinylbenzoic acid--CoA ligase
MFVSKEKMTRSAQATCSFLRLKPGDTALLCMPLQYIGAKMMAVRAVTHHLHLTVREASGHPLKDVTRHIHFAAMTPQQVYNSLQVPQEKARLMQIEKLIIGGGAIPAGLENALQSFPNAVYSTYGMTETLSHVALRRINGEDASPYYTPLPSVKVSLSDENTLVIHAPGLCDGPVRTGDVAEIREDGRFRILGRTDNVINTGGIKIRIESLEEKLQDITPSGFAVTSVQDPRFGEAVVLLMEGAPLENTFRQQFISALPPCERPKHILRVTSIPLTGTGKIDRVKCREIAGRILR